MIINTHETSQDISAILCKILDAGIPLDMILIEYILDYDSECIGKYFDVILNILRYNFEYIGKYWDLILNKFENIGI